MHSCACVPAVSSKRGLTQDEESSRQLMPMLAKQDISILLRGQQPQEK
jgi:hypothetical protein